MVRLGEIRWIYIGICVKKMQNKKIGILTFEQFQGRQNIGSSRIRVKWPLKYWENAEEFVMGQKYDVVIYQKAYWLAYEEIWRH